jgi:hypothetical protein
VTNLIRRTPPLSIIRLWPQHHKDPRILGELLAALRKHHGCCDEVWFCTELGFPKMDVHKRSAESMCRAADKMRDAGILPGIQIANILGHGDLPIFPIDGIAWRLMVGPDGTKARMCNCPLDEKLHAYTREMLHAYAAFHPSSVWIDDDTPRMHNHVPVQWGCFCNVCISEFSKLTGRRWNRKSLVTAVTNPKDGRVRLAWVDFNLKREALICKVAALAVHEAAPECHMALQHCGHEGGGYSGATLAPVFEAMAKATGRTTGSRPGGGFYTDHAPRGMIYKALDISRQVARLPECVDTVCPEVENFTHISMGKSLHGTVVESSLDLAVGCNCLSYAIICSGHENFDFYGQLFERIASYRPFWQKYNAANAGTVPGGLEVVLGMNHAGRPLAKGEDPFAWARANLSRAYQLAAIGLPLCTGAKGACATLLTAEAAAGLTAAELKTILSGGVILDGAALTRIQDRVPKHWLGVRAERPSILDSYEVFTKDKLNGNHAGEYWKLFIFDPASHQVYVLKPTAKKARVLGKYVNHRGEVTGTATVAIENKLGGRIVVFGYDGFEPVVSSARRQQLLAAADWVSNGSLPVLIETTAQVVAVPRIDGRGKVASVFLLNASIDNSPALRIKVRGARGTSCRWLTPAAPDVRLPVKDNEIVARALAPWSVACAVFDR